MRDAEKAITTLLDYLEDLDVSSEWGLVALLGMAVKLPL